MNTVAGHPRLPPLGIRMVLLLLLLPGMAMLMLLDSWHDYRTLTRITNEAYDATLLGPARLLERSVEVGRDDQLHLNRPRYDQIMLGSTDDMRRYARIEEIDPPVPDPAPAAEVRPPSRPLAGTQGLPLPPAWPESNGDPLFFDTECQGDPVRAVALLRDVYHGPRHRQFLVVMAESRSKRDAAEREAWRQELLSDGRMLGLMALLIWVGVSWALHSLERLRRDMRARRADDLTPLAASHVPSEVAPLVEAVNHHVARYRDMLDERAQFLADASHQLRTPLAIMLTQAQYALREHDPARVQEGLRAILDQLGRTRRLTEQLLSLAHANQAAPTPHQVFDLNEVAREVVLQHLPLAHEKCQDLGWEGVRGASQPAEDAGFAAPVLADAAELHEALSNLVHNAISHAPRKARITVSVVRLDDTVEVRITDNGPGIPPALRSRAFARFDRAGAEHGSGSGSGLGLPIAHVYAVRNGGHIELGDGELNAAGGHGLASILRMPLLRDYPQIQKNDSQ